MTPTFSITVGGLNSKQFEAIRTILAGEKAEDEKPAKSKKAPVKTVSPDEDEDLGKEAVDEDEVEDDEDEDEADESEDEDEDESEDEDSDSDDEEEEDEKQAGPSFDEVKKVINRYGKTHPDQMKNILLGFNLKSTKELEKHPKKWEPVLRKTLGALKKLKKK